MGKTAIHFARVLPPWSKRIKNFRQKSRLSQAEFGRQLKCSPMQISRWERGLLKPPVACLIALGKLAGPSGGWLFWNMAGITVKDVRRMLAR